MWDQFSLIMQRSAERMADSIANFVPGLLMLAVILTITALVAVLARVVLVRLLRGLDFDRRVTEAGVPALLEWAPAASPALVVAQAVQWTVVLIGLLIGVTALDAALPAQFAMRVFGYLPNVLAALLILVAGVLVSRFLARSVLINAVNMQIHSARLLSIGIRWLVLVLAGAMALEHLGIGRQILLLAFGILFGGIVLAMALAVGLGSRDLVSRSWEQMLERSREEDRVDHL